MDIAPRSLFLTGEHPTNRQLPNQSAFGEDFLQICLLTGMNQSGSFSPGAPIALKNKKELARPTRSERVPFLPTVVVAPVSPANFAAISTDRKKRAL
ncbi:hypothetical protein [Bradyrhizobium sp. USDA 3364]